MRSDRWKTGWAWARRGGFACAALAWALLAAAPPSASAAEASAARPVVSEAFAGDAALLGVPPSRWRDLAWDRAESAQIAKMIDGFPGASEAIVAVYRPVGPSADGHGFDGGVVRFAAEGCRIVMPPRSSLLSGLAEMARIAPQEVKRMGLDQLEALHELGHCWQRLDSVGFEIPGASVEDNRVLGARVFSPTWQALGEGGRPARLWGEAFADAFMAIEKLAASNDEASRLALATLAQARQRHAPDADDADGGHHPGAGPILAALSEPERWAGMSQAARLRAAAQIASIDAMEELALGEQRRARDAAFLVSDGQVGRLAIEDAARAWIEAGGRADAYQASSLGMVGFEAGRASQAEKLSALMLAAKQAVRSASKATKGFSWTMPREKLEARADAVMRSAMDSAEFQKAMSLFGQAVSEDAVAPALERAGVAAKIAKSPKPEDEGKTRSLLARMGRLVEHAAKATLPSKAPESDPRDLSQRRGPK